MSKLPEIEFERCDDGNDGKDCKNVIQKAYEKFFNIDIKEIENCCNLEREKLINEFKEKNPEDKIKEYNITYKKGIEELTSPFQLSKPSKINIAIKKGEKSKINDDAASDCSQIYKESNMWAISIFLDLLDFSNDMPIWKNFKMTLEEVAYHEFFHTCGEEYNINRNESALRINTIGIKCIKKLIKENF